MRLFFILLLIVTTQFKATAQDQNYLFTNFSYAFFGTGDLGGTAIGIDYHRNLFKRFGLHIGYSKANGKGDHNLFDIDLATNEVDDLIFNGNGSPSSTLATYQTILLGLNYRIIDNQKSVLLATFGANYKNIQNNYLQTTLRTDGQGNSEVELANIQLNANKEAGFYGGVDYLYILDNSMSLGLHIVVEDSDNIVSKMGMSIGFRF